MRVYHVVFNDDEAENIKRWSEEEKMTAEDYIQSLVDEQMEAQLEFERGQKE